MTKTLAREKYKQSVSDRNNEVNRGKNNGTIGILNPCENQSNEDCLEGEKTIFDVK